MVGTFCQLQTRLCGLFLDAGTRECREEGMGIWRDFRRDMGCELVLLAYVITWAVALTLTYIYADGITR